MNRIAALLALVIVIAGGVRSQTFPHFPLEYDNYWRYSDNPWRSLHVRDTVQMPNGKTYALLDLNSTQYSIWFTESILLRQVGPVIYRYRSADSTECVFLDFTKPRLDTAATWKSGAESTYVIFLDTSSTTLFGAKHTMWSFSVTDEAGEVGIIDGIGFSTPTGAVLSGTPYGSLVPAKPFVYPLHIGNRWIYSHGRSVEVVGDTALPNGRSYRKILDDAMYKAWRFQRQEGSRVYEYVPEKNNERVAYDFSRTTGDIVHLETTKSDTFEIVLMSVQPREVFGGWYACATFLYNWRRMIDEEIIYCISDSIGVTMMEGMWSTYEIQRALIDGVKLGDWTTVKRLPSAAPSTTRLHDPYPNPFNHESVVQFDLAARSMVSLKVIDVLGREVATLAEGYYDAGTYAVKVNGASWPSGVYLCRVDASSRSFVKAILLQR